MARKFIVAGNWKMNTTIDEGISLALQIQEGQRDPATVVILAVPFTHLFPIKRKIKASAKIYIAAQNCHDKISGAYTGEISAAVLSELKIPYVIIGHSERRMYNHEDHALLAAKVQTALNNGLKVIFCCGEPLEIRKADDHIGYVRKQLTDSLFMLPSIDMKNIAKFTKIALTLALFMGWGLVANAQPGPPGGPHGGEGDVSGTPGGGAPIGSGIALLLSLGGAWGGKKVYQAYKNAE